MGKFKNPTKTHKMDEVSESSLQQKSDSSLVRRMSASSVQPKVESSDPNKNDLIETYRSVSEIPKKKRKSKFRDLFCFSFKNPAYQRMPKNNRRWLHIYKIMSIMAMILLVVAYTFFILLLFAPIIYVDAGAIVDPNLFKPTHESLLHSVRTLWYQKAYIVIFVVVTFSITLPFVKMLATLIAYLVTSLHRSRQIDLFYGSKLRVESQVRAFSSRSQSDEPNSYESSNFESMDYSVYEDRKITKYAREVLVILKLISKFQMVDSIILLYNICFLRSAFTWSRHGNGLLYLVIYCLTSILGTQLLNLSVEGEHDMFEYWKAVRLLCLPNSVNYDRYYDTFQNNDQSEELEYKNSLMEYNVQYRTSNTNFNETTHLESSSEMDQSNSGLNITEKSTSSAGKNPSVFNLKSKEKSGSFEVISNGTSEPYFYEFLYKDKRKDLKTKWYISEIFVAVLVVLNIVAAGLIISNEKLFGITFTPDFEKQFGVDGTQMTFFEMVWSLRDCWNYLPFFIFYVLSILVPVLFHLSFLAGLFLYKITVSNKDFSSISKFDPGNPLIHPCHSFNLSVKLTKFVLNISNLLSEWSLGEVLALGTVAGYVSLYTAPNVRFYIPPPKFVSVFFIISSFGVTSFLINIQFFMWYTRIINRLSDVTIYVESVNSATTSENGDYSISGKLSHTHLVNDQGMIIGDSKSNLQRLESSIEHNVNDVDNQNTRTPGKRNKVRIMFIKVVDFIRHVIYSKIIVSAFFAFLFLLSLCLFGFGFLSSTPPTKIDERKVQNFLDFGLPGIFNIVKRNLPKSYGDCNYIEEPPKPCSGSSSIYHMNETVYFELVWITGIDSIQFVESNFVVRDDNRLSITSHVKFTVLKPYMKIGACLYGRCNTVYAGENLCCGDDVHVVISVSASCNDDFPHLRNVKFDELKIRNLKFRNELQFLIHKVISIEAFLEKQLLRYINNYLERQEELFDWRGIPFSVSDYINFLTNVNFPHGIKCPPVKPTKPSLPEN
ncbi:Paraquat-inducible protein A family protein [Theileria parva strain Muguga]|uniref:Uncharacterized protein n=1 Tax=Theileria parva TaxID=5875 RepID=Q4N6R2_THEPA|nr:Paraquat-inducible protein A family protein [Theileria parva strain Muguga]EAN34346.1 Paraquat-inducible protein A family protein [Theileria parva strain Muguga]|eukprot:XP_766629.1 hypothetical protein [Theileria parva strain Muguga]